MGTNLVIHISSRLCYGRNVLDKIIYHPEEEPLGEAGP